MVGRELANMENQVHHDHAAKDKLSVMCPVAGCGGMQVVSDERSVRAHLCQHHLDYTPFSCKVCYILAVNEHQIALHARVKHKNIPVTSLIVYDGDEEKETRLEQLYSLVMSQPQQGYGNDHDQSQSSAHSPQSATSPLAVSTPHEHNTIQESMVLRAEMHQPKVHIKAEQKDKLETEEGQGDKLSEAAVAVRQRRSGRSSKYKKKGVGVASSQSLSAGNVLNAEQDSPLMSSSATTPTALDMDTDVKDSHKLLLLHSGSGPTNTEDVPKTGNPCPHCKKVFVDRSSVNRHVKRSCPVLKAAATQPQATGTTLGGDMSEAAIELHDNNVDADMDKHMHTGNEHEQHSPTPQVQWSDASVSPSVSPSSLAAAAAGGSKKKSLSSISAVLMQKAVKSSGLNKSKGQSKAKATRPNACKFACAICGLRFLHSPGLMQHLKHKHPPQPQSADAKDKAEV